MTDAAASAFAIRAQEEGRHRAYALKDGRYVDALTMARLHPSPPGLGG